jgi:hypothetical protein
MPLDREVRIDSQYFLGLFASFGKLIHLGVARSQPDAGHDVIREAHDRLSVGYDGLVELPQQELSMRKGIEIPARMKRAEFDCPLGGPYRPIWMARPSQPEG